jgi:hypothetical protein
VELDDPVDVVVVAEAAYEANPIETKVTAATRAKIIPSINAFLLGMKRV